MSQPASSRRTPLVLLTVGGLVVLAGLVGPGLVRAVAPDGMGTLLSGHDCVVQTADGEVGLTRDQARLATTAAAGAGEGNAVDPAVLERLRQGPPDDAGPSLSCRGTAADGLPEESLTASGLTPRAERVRQEMAQVFGEQSLGGFAPGGVGQGHGEESTHYDGRAIDVFFRPVSQEQRREGWLLAHWLVAHADELDLQYVIFDDLYWSAHSSRGRWSDYEAPAPANEILRHLDHVHVDVHRGGDQGS